MSIMEVMDNKAKNKEWTIGVSDRCDQCGAQAFIKVIGNSGELFFCSHHYNKIVDNAVGYDKIMKFAIDIIDEREKLIENRLVGSEN